VADEYIVEDAATGGRKGQKLARFDLLPWDSVWEVAEHFGKGAAKYGEDRNWERSYPWSLSIAALARHFALFAQGEDIDEETGSNHMAAVAFHALVLLRFSRDHREQDDRPGSHNVVTEELPEEK
jgi:hypothetical protein